MRVGELARQAGISVRALRHYHEIGLLVPSLRTPSGHRLYTRRNVIRLQQIMSLRKLGFSLEEIGQCLKGRRFSPRRVIGLHIAHLRKQMERQRRLCARLEALEKRFRSSKEIPVGEFIEIIKEMAMIERYFSQDQLRQLEERRRTIPAERIRAVEQEWPELIEQVRAEMAKGTDPTSKPVRALAERWMSLVAEFSGGDAGIEKSLGTMYRKEPGTAARYGLDREIFEYIKTAAAANEQKP
jgi:DNA-binding transcriptional MerR regulator